MDELIRSRSCNPHREGAGWTCDRWRSAKGEWFCGHCGKPLPPVGIALKPDSGSSAKPGQKKREVAVVLEGADAKAKAELKDFRVAVEISDPNEESDDIALDSIGSAGAGGLVLGLENAAGGAPFDVALRLHHRDLANGGQVVAEGAYDYPEYRLFCEDGGPLAIPPERAPFTVRLRSEPPGAVVRSAELRFENPDLELPGRALSGTDSEAVLRFDPDDGAWAVLSALHGLGTATLAVRFKGLAQPVRLPVEVVRKTPARLTGALSPGNRAMTGRNARMAVFLRNEGGLDAVIGAAGYKILAHDNSIVAEGRLDNLVGRTIQGGQSLHEEIRPALRNGAGEPLPAMMFGIAFDIHFDSGGTASQLVLGPAEIEVVAEQDFTGTVCIDFGTTDTAAAVILPGETYFLMSQTGEVPQPLELGPLAAGDGKAQHFLPTRAVIGIDSDGRLERSFGTQKAPAGLKYVRVLDRLKWRLGRNLPIEGYGELAISELVTGYLKTVRQLIEDHPRVAARVREVVATRPARFGETKLTALIECFNEAGMAAELECFGSGAKPLVSESWPPMLLAVPLDETDGPPSARLLKSLFAQFPDENPPALFDAESLAEGPHYVCTFDVGGGSLDISVLEVSIDGEQVRVGDVKTFTDTDFAGEPFRDLIVDELKKFFPDVSADDTTPVRRANLDALRRLAFELQRFPTGLFATKFSSAEVFFNALKSAPSEVRNYIDSWLGQTNLSATTEIPPDAPEVLKALWSEVVFDNATAGRTAEYRAELTTNSGARRNVVIGLVKDGKANPMLVLLACRIIAQFGKRFEPKLTDYFHKIGDKLGANPAPERIRLLLTGRGSLLTLAQALVMQIAESVGIPRGNQYLSSGQSAKAVTSWGGAALAASRKVTTFFEFTGIGATGYALYGPRSPVRPVPPYLPLKPIDGRDLWGLPLSELKPQFSNCRRIFVGDNQGPIADFDYVAELSSFNLNSALEQNQGGWIVFDPGTRQIALRHGGEE
jgi:hypothetical protein